jgi:hypothetical protein
VLPDDGPVGPKHVGVILKLILICIEGFIVCPCNMINIFIITNTMHTIGVDKITLFKTT